MTSSETKPNHKEYPLLSNTYSGLNNQGNTCYLNSLLQTLFMTKPFRNTILNWKYKENIHGNKNDSIIYQLQKLFLRLKAKHFQSESTVGLTTSFQWKENQVNEQQDIQELTRILLEAIEKSIEQEEKGRIFNLFEGTIESIVKCLVCSNESIRIDSYLDLSLPIRGSSSLEMSLKSLLKEENLTGDNKYLCSFCKIKQNAVKFSRLNVLPYVLFIHLSRFEYDFHSLSYRKVNDRFDFPFRINMRKYLMKSFIEKEENIKEDDYEYELYSILVHSGTVSNGHYYSIINSYEDKKWYKFDDDKVFEIRNDDVQQLFGGDKETAYCLLYRQRHNYKDYLMNDSEYTIPDYILSEINEENKKISEELKKKEEKRSLIKVRFNINNVIYVLEVNRHSKISQLKEDLIIKENILQKIGRNSYDYVSSHIYNQMNISEKEEVKQTFRIRQFNVLLKRSIDIYDNEEVSIEEANFHLSNKVFTIEVKMNKEEEYSPDLIMIEVLIWNGKYSQTRSGSGVEFREYVNSFSYYVNLKSSYDKFKEEIIKFAYDNSRTNDISQCKDSITNNTNFIIFIKKEMTNNEFIIIDLLNKNKLINESKSSPHNHTLTVEDLNIHHNKMPIYIEESSYEDSKLINFFNEQAYKVKILYNNPLEIGINPKIGLYSYENLIEINKKQTILELKRIISVKLGLSENEFLLKKNSHNGMEIKNLNDKIEKYTSSQMKIFIEKGVFYCENNIKINVLYGKYDEYNDMTVFQLVPLVVFKINEMSIDERMTIREMKDLIKKDVLNKVNERQSNDCKSNKEKVILTLDKYNILASINWDFSFLRHYNNEKLYGYYNDELLISQSKIKNGSNVMLFCKDQKETICNPHLIGEDKKILINLIKIDPFTWRLSSIKEVFIDRGIISYNNQLINHIKLFFPDIDVRLRLYICIFIFIYIYYSLFIKGNQY